MTDPDYEERRLKADEVLPIQIAVANNIFRTVMNDLEVADRDNDMKKVTDLFICSRVFRLSLRTRDRSYFAKYWNEATFRWPGEWEKVLNGNGDWMLYQFETEDRQSVVAWSLIWLPGLRAAEAAAKADTTGKIKRCFVVTHREGESSFMAVNLLGLHAMGFDIIHDTSDERMALENITLRTLEGQIIRKAVK